MEDNAVISVYQKKQGGLPPGNSQSVINSSGGEKGSAKTSDSKDVQRLERKRQYQRSCSPKREPAREGSDQSREQIEPEPKKVVVKMEVPEPPKEVVKPKRKKGVKPKMQLSIGSL